MIWMNQIFARKVTVLHKNGYRTDYTHVTEFRAYIPKETEPETVLGPLLLLQPYLQLVKELLLI